MIAYLAVAGTVLTLGKWYRCLCFNLIYIFLINIFLFLARKPLTRLTVKETQLEGQLRFVHSRLIQNCEEVAFLKGKFNLVFF